MQNEQVNLESRLSRREFFGALGGVAAWFALGSHAAADDTAGDKLRTFRKELFGGIFLGGTLRKVSPKTYRRSHKEFFSAVVDVDATKFMSRETQAMYQRVEGDLELWRADRDVVVATLVEATTIPDYETHGRIRTILHSDGILDFPYLKLQIEQFVDEGIKSYHKGGAEGALAGQALRFTPDACDALRSWYLMTTPLAVGEAYNKKLDEEIRKTRKKAFDALENARNAAAARNAGRTLELAHQTAEGLMKLHGLYGAMLEMQESAGQHMLEKHDERKYRKIEVGGKLYGVFDYVAEEFRKSELETEKFNEWKGMIQGKVDGAMGGK